MADDGEDFDDVNHEEDDTQTTAGSRHPGWQFVTKTGKTAKGSQMVQCNFCKKEFASNVSRILGHLIGTDVPGLASKLTVKACSMTPDYAKATLNAYLKEKQGKKRMAEDMDATMAQANKEMRASLSGSGSAGTPVVVDSAGPPLRQPKLAECIGHGKKVARCSVV